ncbi:MAG: hypothetical protein IPH07_19530 [Deltaproteobacteria bacterium]|jgi:hypothetical protein|nr:hypothetical protein [Deltaproteobacteria bacterium]MBK8715895.1 hypothetical protein [Deltaproteobacteria bacterium]MBP7286627.1 hypothetical protein [Nannocystaceae bacterium]
MNDKKNKQPLVDESKFADELDEETLANVLGGISIDPRPLPGPGIPGAGGPIPGDCDW